MDDPSAIAALEQYVYWNSLGLSHEDMLRAVDLRPPWRGYISAHDTIYLLAQAYRALQQQRAA